MISRDLVPLLALLFSLTQGAFEPLSCEDYSRAYVAIDRLIDVNVMAIPGFVRLAFHDCVGQGCNGCLNFRDANNNGLEPWAGSLERIYSGQFDTVMSRADFWQLAAQVALIRGASNRPCETPDEGCTFFEHQFYAGRKDCPGSPHSDPIPDTTGNAHGDYPEVRKSLRGMFGLTDREVVAAMGAHALGGGFPNASGFSLPWSTTFLTFDNQYYKNILSLPFAHMDTTQIEFGLVGGFPRKQFVDFTVTPVPLMMLNVDMALWKDLKAEKVNGRFTGALFCPTEDQKKAEVPLNTPGAISACKNNRLTAKYVEEFAADLGTFYTAWEETWYKLSTHKNSGLYKTEQCGNCIPVGGLCGVGFEKSGRCCAGSSCQESFCVAE